MVRGLVNSACYSPSAVPLRDSFLGEPTCPSRRACAPRALACAPLRPPLSRIHAPIHPRVLAPPPKHFERRTPNKRTAKPKRQGVFYKAV